MPGSNIIAVCSWSLKCPDAASLTTAVRQLGLQHVHLALGMLVTPQQELRQDVAESLRGSGLKFTAGMVGFQGEDYHTIESIRKTGGFVPTELWPLRRQWLRACCRAAQAMGISRVTTHIGFVPPSSEPGYETMVKRVQEVAGEMQDQGMTLLMETGQEPASELLQFLHDVSRKNVGVNFDPANMILYGAGDPIQAVHTLAAHIQHVHVKDAVASGTPGSTWGQEVPFGQGAVHAGQFLASLAAEGYSGPLAIEREAGVQRIQDVQTAVQLISRLKRA